MGSPAWEAWDRESIPPTASWGRDPSPVIYLGFYKMRVWRAVSFVCQWERREGSGWRGKNMRRYGWSRTEEGGKGMKGETQAGRNKGQDSPARGIRDEGNFKISWLFFLFCPSFYTILLFSLSTILDHIYTQTFMNSFQVELVSWDGNGKGWIDIYVKFQGLRWTF